VAVLVTARHDLRPEAAVAPGRGLDGVSGTTGVRAIIVSHIGPWRR
jgi:hypothetical protein